MFYLSKAFDPVNHELPLNKLCHYGIRETDGRLLSSYITNRIRYVDLNKFISPFQQIEYGVPQDISRLATILNFY